MTAPTNPSSDRTLWRAWRCPRCHYDLAALPAAHACPECGLECAPDTLVLVAHVPAHRKGNLFNLAYAVFLGGLGFTYLARGNQGQGLWRALIAVVMVGVFIYALVRRAQLKARGETDFALAIDATGIEIWAGGRMKKRLPLQCLVDARCGTGDAPSMIVIKRFLKSSLAIDFAPPEIDRIIQEIRHRRRL